MTRPCIHLPPPPPVNSSVPPPLLVDSKEAARLLGISERSLWQLCKDGALPFLRVGRRLKRFRPADLEAFASGKRG